MRRLGPSPKFLKFSFRGPIWQGYLFHAKFHFQAVAHARRQTEKWISELIKYRRFALQAIVPVYKRSP